MQPKGAAQVGQKHPADQWEKDGYTWSLVVWFETDDIVLGVGPYRGGHMPVGLRLRDEPLRWAIYPGGLP